MAPPVLKYAIGNSASTSQSGSITGSDTSIILNSSTNFQAAPTPGEGMILMDEGQPTEELAYATGISGSTLTIPLANRGLEGTSSSSHDGATVKGVLTQDMWNDLISSLSNAFDRTTGAVDGTKVVKTNAPVFTLGSDAQGDIYYRNGSGAIDRLAAGTSGHFLKTQGAGANPTWASASVTQPRCFVRNAGNISVSDNTGTTVTWDTEDTDPNTMHDTGSNTSRITVPSTGVYLVTAHTQWQNSGTGYRRVWFRVNGSDTYGVVAISSTSSDQTGIESTALLSLTANDYVEVRVLQNSGGSLNLLGGSTTEASYFRVIKISE